jgi:SAM-dependent methyltransferase
VTSDESYALPPGSGAGWTDDYERGRPGWPPEVVSVAATPSTATVMELGAGTGKLTRLLVRHFDRVVTVEPQPAMHRWLAELCPEASVIGGSAEHIPRRDSSVEAVFIAEAFHKFDGDRSLREIARVLTPGGALVLMWNVPVGPVEPSIDAVDRLLEERGPDPRHLEHDMTDLNPVRFSTDQWRLPFAGSPFGEIREVRLHHVQTLDREGLVSFLASMGWIGQMPDDERLDLLDRIRALLTSGEYRRTWESRVFWTRLSEA